MPSPDQLDKAEGLVEVARGVLSGIPTEVGIGELLTYGLLTNILEKMKEVTWSNKKIIPRGPCFEPISAPFSNPRVQARISIR